MTVDLPEPSEESEPEPEPSGDMPPPRPPSRTAVGTGGPDEDEPDEVLYMPERMARKWELDRLHDALEQLWLRRIE